MGLKASQFNMVQPFNRKQLLYNTYTTSAVILDQSFYRKVFVKNKAADSESMKALQQMGFLVDEDLDEIEMLKEIWRTSAKSLDDTMDTILIAPTMLCNARCYYCFEQAEAKGCKPNAQIHMNKCMMNQLVEFICEKCTGKKLGIHWFGGEPLIAQKEIEYMTNRLREKGIEVYAHMTTNGSLIDEKVIKRLKHWNVQKLQITIDGIGDKYNRIKNYRSNPRKDYFTRVMKNIEDSLAADIKVNLRANFDPENLSESLETIEYLMERFKGYSNCFIYAAPITDINVKAVTEEFKGEHPYYRLMRLTKRYQRYNFAIVSEAGEEIYHDAFNDKQVPVGNKNMVILKNKHLAPIPLPCMAVTKKSYAVDPAGFFYRCHRLLGKGEMYASGKLIDGEYVSLEKEAYFDEVVFPYEECKHCPVAPLCMGGCKANRLLYEKRHVCCHVKAIVNQLIKDYINEVNPQ